MRFSGLYSINVPHSQAPYVVHPVTYPVHLECFPLFFNEGNHLVIFVYKDLSFKQENVPFVQFTSARLSFIFNGRDCLSEHRLSLCLLRTTVPAAPSLTQVGNDIQTPDPSL